MFDHAYLEISGGKISRLDSVYTLLPVLEVLEGFLQVIYIFSTESRKGYNSYSVLYSVLEREREREREREKERLGMCSRVWQCFIFFTIAFVLHKTRVFSAYFFVYEGLVHYLLALGPINILCRSGERKPIFCFCGDLNWKVAVS